jgi:hypothetical protein
MTTPARLPDAASLETVLAGLVPASADADLLPALTAAFPGFEFSFARIDDDYWRDIRSVIRPDGTRLGALRPWMTAELAKGSGDIDALWQRLKDTDLQITEWRGTSAFVFAPTGPAAADYIQIALGRESEWQAAPIVNPDYRPFGEEELFDPSWIRRDELGEADRLVGPVYRLLDRAGGALVQAVPDWFEHVPRERRFFEDWEQSSAGAQRCSRIGRSISATTHTRESARLASFRGRCGRPRTGFCQCPMPRCTF